MNISNNCIFNPARKSNLITALISIVLLSGCTGVLHYKEYVPGEFCECGFIYDPIFEELDIEYQNVLEYKGTANSDYDVMRGLLFKKVDELCSSSFTVSYYSEGENIFAHYGVWRSATVAYSCN